MDRWKNIYESAGRRLAGLFSRTAGEEEESGLPDELSAFQASYCAQEKYDASAAFRKLQMHKKRIWIRRWSVAAGILLVVSFSGWLMYENYPVAQMVEMVQHQPVVRPGERKAILTLAGGEVMSIRDSSLALSDLEACMKADTNRVHEQIAWHTLSVPRGGEFFMTLPDSTQVWLNSESELRFPARFGSESRKVELKGEAYFDVTHQKGKPFIVGLHEGIIMVYGTQFCVSDYQNSALKATLVEGSIGFESFSGKKRKICPSQQLTYDISTDRIDVREVNTRVYTSWKDQLFCFEDQELEEIMGILARWYDLDIFFETEELKQIKFSGTLDKYADIHPFLRLFEAGANVKFDIQQKNVIIRKAN